MYVLKLLILSLSLVFALSGCGGGGSGGGIDNNITDLTISLPVSESTLDENSQNVTIDVNVYDTDNTPYQNGNVKVIYPDDVKTGRDVGHFSSSSVALNNGTALFSYIGPGDITSNGSNIVFKFYHEDNPTILKTYTIKINPEQAVLTNYTLNSSDANVTMDLESSKLIVFSITNDDNIPIDDSKIISVKVTSLNPNIGTLEDYLGNTGSSLTIVGKNNITMNVNSKTSSGIIPLSVVAKFLDANNNSQTLTKTFNTLVLSGPPSAMSISSSISANYVEDRAKHIEQFVLTVTDKYNNLVNTNPAVSMGMIAGFTQASSSTDTNRLNYLYVGTGVDGGTLSPTNKFTAKTNIFDNVDTSNDVLVTFGTNEDGYTYNASGKWDIISKTSNTLSFSDDYMGSSTSNLGFAVGHNYRQLTCSTSGEEAIANVYPNDNNFIVPANGSMIINIEYDNYLVGKTVVLWVNLVGENHKTNDIVKIGEAKKIGLLGTGLKIYENGSNTYNAGDTGIVRVYIGIDSTNDYYRNGRFGYVIQAADDLNWTIDRDSMDSNINNCAANEGLTYVDVNILTPAPAAGEITFKSLLPILGGEF